MIAFKSCHSHAAPPPNPRRLVHWWIAFTLLAFAATLFPQATADTARYCVRFVTASELSERKAFRRPEFISIEFRWRISKQFAKSQLFDSAAVAARA